MIRYGPPLLFVFALLASCTQFPPLDRTITPQLEAADYPALVALGPVLAQAGVGQVDRSTPQAAMESRVTQLRARAARLRGSVLAGSERQRLSQGLR